MRLLRAFARAFPYRTGVMVALFRIALENWTPEQAIAEMRAFHFHRFLFPHLKHYVEGFPEELATEPNLRALRTGAHASGP